MAKGPNLMEQSGGQGRRGEIRVYGNKRIQKGEGLGYGIEGVWRGLAWDTLWNRVGGRADREVV